MQTRKDQLLYSFETPESVAQAITNHTRLQRVAQGVSQGKHALKVEFLPDVDWPNLMFRAEGAWNWSRYAALSFELTNPTSEPVAFGVRVDDDSRADGERFCRQGSGSAPPKKRVSYLFPLAHNPMDYGMRGLPGIQGYTLIGTSNEGKINLNHIVAFQIFMARQSAMRTLIVDNIRLIHYDQTFHGIVDSLGQYSRGKWSGKMANDDTMRKHLSAEQRELARLPSLPDMDRYGGWKSGPKRNPTGWFRVEKIDGVWWLITPDGQPFFSAGIDCVGMGDATFIEKRETMFQSLPAEGDPLSRHFAHLSGAHMGPIKEGKAFNFYSANLERKYGKSYSELWRKHTLKRLRSWGFNTIGNWSSWDFYQNGQVPYVATAHVQGDHKRISSGSDYWGKMHDPYDPVFAKSVHRSLEPVANRVKEDPWCIGFFVDNELSWAGTGEEGGRYGLAYGALSAIADESPAKRAFLEQLHKKYGDIHKFNEAWGTEFQRWQDLDAPLSLPSNPTAARPQDMGAFVHAFALRYFETIREVLRSLAPKHLYLGCRFAWYSLDAVEACAKVCDVISFNIYAPKVDPAAYGFLSRLDKPVIIGEFHFGALDQGMFHTGLVAAENQRERARMYEQYLHSVLDHPQMIGCHWFQYVDQPLTGRWFDGENYNIGFVTITDTPYPEMVQSARRTHGSMYQRRSRLKRR